MSGVFYCSKCDLLEVRKEHSESNTTWVNIRDGYGLPIFHQICDNCNYVLSGFIYLPNINKQSVEYYKSIIKDYSTPNGLYVRDKFEYIQNDIIKNYKGKNLEIKRWN